MYGHQVAIVRALDVHLHLELQPALESGLVLDHDVHRVGCSMGQVSEALPMDLAGRLDCHKHIADDAPAWPRRFITPEAWPCSESPAHQELPSDLCHGYVKHTRPLTF